MEKKNSPGVLGKIYQFERNFLTTETFGEIVLHQIGELYCEVGYEVPDHKQWCYEISYIKSGSGTMYLNSVPSKVRPGDIFVNGRHSSHRIFANMGSQLKYLYAGFDLSEAASQTSNLLSALKYMDETAQPCVRDNVGVGDVLDKLVKEFGCERDYYREVVTALLRMLICLTYRNSRYDNSMPECPTNGGEDVGVVVYTILRYVDDHIGQLSSIRDLSESLNYNYSYISHLFKKRMGVTLQKYIVDKKMEKAVELMLEDELTATQAAERLGYQSVQAFSKVFHGTHGLSPTAYVARAKGARKE